MNENNMLEKRILFSVFVFIQLFSSIGFSQNDTLYFDTNENEITKVSFKSKLNSKICDGYRYSTDTLVVQELIPNHVFGQLRPISKSQLFKLLSLRSDIDTLKILSVYYKDTLITRNEFPKKDFMIFRDSLGEVMGTSKRSGAYFDGRRYRNAKYREVEYSYKGFNKIALSILKKNRKFKHVMPLFFYSYNKGLDLNALKVKWSKDHGHIIKNLFRFKDFGFRQLILKPNGEFFVRIGSKKITFKELFDEKEWNVHRDAYFNEIKKN